MIDFDPDYSWDQDVSISDELYYWTLAYYDAEYEETVESFCEEQKQLEEDEEMKQDERPYSHFKRPQQVRGCHSSEGSAEWRRYNKRWAAKANRRLAKQLLQEMPAACKLLDRS